MFFVDNTAPDMLIDGISKGAVVVGTINISTKTSDEDSTVQEVTVDDQYPVIGSELNTGALDEGEHSIIVKAKDAAGNKARKCFNFIVNNDPLKVTKLNVENTPKVGGNVEISAEVEGFRKGGKQVMIDGKVVSEELPYGWNANNVEDGPHNITVRVYNEPTGELKGKSVQIEVDNTSPKLTLPEQLQKGKEQSIELHPPTRLSLKVKSNEELSRLVRNVNGEKHSTETLLLHAGKVGEVVKISFTAVDIAGNTKSVSREVKIVGYDSQTGRFKRFLNMLVTYRGLRLQVFFLIFVGVVYLISWD